MSFKETNKIFKPKELDVKFPLPAQTASESLDNSSSPNNSLALPPKSERSKLTDEQKLLYLKYQEAKRQEDLGSLGRLGESLSSGFHNIWCRASEITSLCGASAITAATHPKATLKYMIAACRGKDVEGDVDVQALRKDQIEYISKISAKYETSSKNGSVLREILAVNSTETFSLPGNLWLGVKLGANLALSCPIDLLTVPIYSPLSCIGEEIAARKYRDISGNKVCYSKYLLEGRDSEQVQNILLGFSLVEFGIASILTVLTAGRAGNTAVTNTGKAAVFLSKIQAFKPYTNWLLTNQHKVGRLLNSYTMSGLNAGGNYLMQDSDKRDVRQTATAFFAGTAHSAAFGMWLRTLGAGLKTVGVNQQTIEKFTSRTDKFDAGNDGLELTDDSIKETKKFLASGEKVTLATIQNVLLPKITGVAMRATSTAMDAFDLSPKINTTNASLAINNQAYKAREFYEVTEFELRSKFRKETAGIEQGEFKGFYDEKTNAIYLNKHLSDSEKKAHFAHELRHRFGRLSDRQLAKAENKEIELEKRVATVRNVEIRAQYQEEMQRRSEGKKREFNIEEKREIYQEIKQHVKINYLPEFLASTVELKFAASKGEKAPEIDSPESNYLKLIVAGEREKAAAYLQEHPLPAEFFESEAYFITEMDSYIRYYAYDKGIASQALQKLEKHKSRLIINLINRDDGESYGLLLENANHALWLMKEITNTQDFHNVPVNIRIRGCIILSEFLIPQGKLKEILDSSLYNSLSAKEKSEVTRTMLLEFCLSGQSSFQNIDLPALFKSEGLITPDLEKEFNNLKKYFHEGSIYSENEKNSFFRGENFHLTPSLRRVLLTFGEMACRTGRGILALKIFEFSKQAKAHLGLRESAEIKNICLGQLAKFLAQGQGSKAHAFYTLLTKIYFLPHSENLKTSNLIESAELGIKTAEEKYSSGEITRRDLFATYLLHSILTSSNEKVALQIIAAKIDLLQALREARGEDAEINEKKLADQIELSRIIALSYTAEQRMEVDSRVKRYVCGAMILHQAGPYLLEEISQNIIKTLESILAHQPEATKIAIGEFNTKLKRLLSLHQALVTKCLNVEKMHLSSSLSLELIEDFCLEHAEVLIVLEDCLKQGPKLIELIEEEFHNPAETKGVNEKLKIIDKINFAKDILQGNFKGNLISPKMVLTELEKRDIPFFFNGNFIITEQERKESFSSEFIVVWKFDDSLGNGNTTPQYFIEANPSVLRGAVEIAELAACASLAQDYEKLSEGQRKIYIDVYSPDNGKTIIIKISNLGELSEHLILPLKSGNEKPRFLELDPERHPHSKGIFGALMSLVAENLGGSVEVCNLSAVPLSEKDIRKDEADRPNPRVEVKFILPAVTDEGIAKSSQEPETTERSRRGKGFRNGPISKAVIEYLDSLKNEFIRVGLESSNAEVFAHSLVRIKNESIMSRRDLFSAQVGQAILDYQILDSRNLDAFIRKIQAEERIYKSLLDKKTGRSIFSDKDVKFLLYNRLIPFDWVEMFLQIGFVKSEIISLFAKNADSIERIAEIKILMKQLEGKAQNGSANGLSPEQQEAIKTLKLTPGQVKKLIIKNNKPLEKVLELAEIYKIFIAEGLSPTDAKKIILNNRDPRKKLLKAQEFVAANSELKIADSELTIAKSLLLRFGIMMEHPQKELELRLEKYGDLDEFDLTPVQKYKFLLETPNPVERIHEINRIIKVLKDKYQVPPSFARYMAINWEAAVAEWGKRRHVKEGLMRILNFPETDAYRFTLDIPIIDFESLQIELGEIEKIGFSAAEARFIYISYSNHLEKAKAVKASMDLLSGYEIKMGREDLIRILAKEDLDIVKRELLEKSTLTEVQLSAVTALLKPKS